VFLLLGNELIVSSSSTLLHLGLGPGVSALMMEVGVEKGILTTEAIKALPLTLSVRISVVPHIDWIKWSDTYTYYGFGGGVAVIPTLHGYMGKLTDALKNLDAYLGFGFSPAYHYSESSYKYPPTYKWNKDHTQMAGLSFSSTMGVMFKNRKGDGIFSMEILIAGLRGAYMFKYIKKL